MFRIVLLTIIVTIVSGQVDQFEDNDVFVAAEDLPPGTIVRVRRQVFGGLTNLPNGGFNQEVGARSPTNPSAWGSVSQSFGPRGQSGPQIFKGGLDLTSPQGHGLSASALHIPHVGSQATAGGQLNLLNTPNHNLNAFGSHTKTFDNHFKEVGRGSSTAGLGYQHVSGAGLNLAGTHTPGAPNSGTLGATLPLYTNKNTNFNLNSQSSFAHGQKPNHFFGLNFQKKF